MSSPMKKITKSNIIYSNPVSNLVKQPPQMQEENANLIDIDQYQYVIPRIFPNSKIPTKVAVYRKIKQFNSVNLNQILSDVKWHQGQAQLQLKNFVFTNQFVYQYGCSAKNIQGNKVKGRAYCKNTKKYQQFQVNGYNQQNNSFDGNFMLKQSQYSSAKKIKSQDIHRSMICFNFQDPIFYANQINQAIKRRNKVLEIIKYQFFVDNMDLQGAPAPSAKILHNIKQMVMGCGCNGRDLQFSYGEFIFAVNHYKRVMNQLLFRNQIQVQELPIYLPTKYRKKNIKQDGKHIRKKLKVLKKDNKIITLIPKSTKQKLQDIKIKYIFVNDHIADIVLFLKSKLYLKPYTYLFLQLKETIIQKYLIEQQRSFDYCYSALNQYIVDPLSTEIRNKLTQFPDGWFRVYQQNRYMYMQSKLRRLFIMVNNVIKDWTVDQLGMGLKDYQSFLREHTPEQVIIRNLHSTEIKMTRQSDFISKYYHHIIVIELIIEKGRLKLSHSSQRVNKLLKKLLLKSMQLFSRIPSPEPIVLKQLFGGYRNQQGIKIQLPIHQDSPSNYWFYPQIKQHYLSILKQIDKICEPLLNYQTIIVQTENKINMRLLTGQTSIKLQTIKQITTALQNINKIQQTARHLFDGFGCCIGFFYINYQFVKVQILQMINSQRQSYRRRLLTQNKRMNTIFNKNIKQIQKKLQTKPKTVQQLIKKQQLMKNLQQQFKKLQQTQLKQIRQLCVQYGCKIEYEQLNKQIQTENIINGIYKSQQQLNKQYELIKKQEVDKLEAAKKNIEQNIAFLRFTNQHLSHESSSQNHVQVTKKIRYLRQMINAYKAQALQIHKKQAMLQIQLNQNNLFQQLNKFQKQFQPYQLLWLSVQDWKNTIDIWMNQPIGSFQLKQPQNMIKNLINNLKKASFIFANLGKKQLQEVAIKLKKQIQQFQPKLQLLRLLKKKGLSRRHLQQIDIIITCQLQSMTFKQALQMGFYQKLNQIQAISNDAWNQFSLEQTLDRLLKQINQLKFKINSYKDRKRNDILIIVNYKQLTEQIDVIFNNIQAVQFNPMIKLFEGPIKLIHQKIQYMSKSVNICEQFQKILVQLHPIFDSTDIVKQIPAQNKRFSKVLRIWLQLLQYIKNIQSVSDACGSQNIYEKVKSIYTNIEIVKKQLITYLQQKRKGFSRFYLLSNSQMFQLFSATNDINSVNRLIPKLFDSITHLTIQRPSSQLQKYKQSESQKLQKKQQPKIIGINSGRNCKLDFIKKVNYVGINIENWLNNLQKQIKFSINDQVMSSIQQIDKINWIQIIQNQIYLPQTVYLLYQIVSTDNIFRNISKLQKSKQKYSSILQQLVNRKKQHKTKKLTQKSDLILRSLIILTTSKQQIIDRFIKLNITNVDNFELKKLIKSKLVKDKQDDCDKIMIQTLNYKNQYGYEFLGIYSRLVVTSLTQKMQVFYCLAQKYSLGIAAIGPAGTGKSQTTKDISKLVGKSCLIYNCSQNFHESTFLRLLKGLAITGLWMCFDQFNRLNYKILSIAAEQLSYLLKFRSYGHRMEVSFLGQTIWINSNFQFCVTYNPTYQGRQTIPKNLTQLFRTVAVTLPDQFAICQALLYSSGYTKGSSLARRIINVFKICRQIWEKQQIYDFGLRALRSVISMSNKFFTSQKQGQQSSIIQSLKILNSPKMKQDDNQIFLKIVQKQFETVIVTGKKQQQRKLSQKVINFNAILNIRNGILLCGQPLSGKYSVIQQFKTNFTQWQISTIYHDVLQVDQIYGQLDPSTKLWRDGFFTSIVRNNINLGQKRPKLMIVMNGSVYSEWVQNLNSFLDATRKLSLSSGQTISIPNTLKIVVSCTDLQKATPATITRFGIIKYQPLKINQLAKKIDKFPQKLLLFYQQVQQKVINLTLASFDTRFILNWVLQSIKSGPINYDTFIFYLTQIYDGLLTEKGRQQYEKLCRKYLTIPISPFELILKINGQPTSLSAQFKKFKKYQDSNQQFSQQKYHCFQDIFVPTPRSYKLIFNIQHYLSKTQNKKQDRFLMIIGDQNIGKSRISQYYLNRLPKQKYKKVSLYFTRKTTAKVCHQQIQQKLLRKSNTKLGSVPGHRINIWIQDFNMPSTNKYDIITTVQLIRLIFSYNQWYNYETLSKQTIQDITILSDAKITYFNYKHPLNINPRLYRHIQPIFCDQINKQQLCYIFKQIIYKSLGHNLKNQLSQNLLSGQLIQKIVLISNQAIDFYWELKNDQIFDKNIISFNINDLYRSLKGFISWKLPQDIIKINQVFQYQLSRNLISKIATKSLKIQINNMMNRSFNINNKNISSYIFHNLEHANISNIKCEKIENIIQFTNKFQFICDQYRNITKQQYSIIIFPQMIQYLIKIYRTLYLNNSHVVVVGMSKCGKNTIIKLASYLISSDIYRIKQSNENKLKDWQEGIKTAMKMSYKNKNNSILLIKHKYLTIDQCTQDINKLLNTMSLTHIYSQADTQQMIYMMQAELVRKNIQVNKQNMWHQFIKYLKQKLHIVLLMNPSFNTFKTCLVHYPSIIKLCTFFYIDKWPKQALYLIAQQDMSHLGYNLDLLPQIHNYCLKICENSKLSILDTIWEGMYFNFVSILGQIYQKNRILYMNRKIQYQQSQKVITQTQNQLQQTKRKIKKLQPAIIMIQNQTAKTVKNLQIQRKNAQQTNKKLLVKNQEIQKIISQSRTLKIQLQQKVQVVNLQLQKAWQNVSLIKPAHISQVKALANPSQFIKTVLAALVILTYDGPLLKQIKDVNGHISVEQSYFETAKKYVLSKDAKSICRMLIQFKRQNVSKQMFQKLQQKCLSYKRWSQKQAKSANKAIYYFFIWVQAVANQYRIYEQTQPLRDQLQKTSTLLSNKQIQISTIKKQLDLYQTKITQYEAQHKIKKQSLQQYRIQIRKYERMLNRGHELLKQISGQKQKWINYIKQIDKKIQNNFGDSIIMSATIVYMSVHVYEIRKKIKQHISKLCKKYNILCTVTGTRACQIPWYLSREQQQIYQTLQINNNQLLIDNIKIAQNNNNKLLLLLDPQEQGIKIMKQINWQYIQAPIDKITQYSLNLIKYIQSAILYGRIIFIEIDPTQYNNLLNFIIHPVLVQGKQKKQIKNGDKNIPIHQNYRIYLYTTNYSLNKKYNKYSMELLTNVQTINFKMTNQQLQHKILQIIINHQMPMLKAKIQQIFRINIKDTITLNSIQQKLLQMFSNQLSPQEILENDQIINTVIHSNRLYKQIESRKLQSKLQQQQIQLQKRPYYKKSQQICHIYQNIQRLKLINNLYSYSYYWFLDLFQYNIYNFNIALYQSISKILKNDQKIMIAILIAQVIHPNLPWKCLFNVQQNKINKTIYSTINEQDNQQIQQLHQSTISIKSNNNNNNILQLLGSNIKQLPVSQTQWNRINGRIGKVKRYIPTLQQVFNQNPQLFIQLVQAFEQQILQAIPNQYSHLDYFYRILLISCFRPQCVIKLLKQWIKINMGQSFIQNQLTNTQLLANTRPYRPIITILSQNITSLQAIQNIRQIYKITHPKLTTNIPIITYYFTLQEIVEFDNIIKAAIVQDQWVILQAINTIQDITYIKQYFQELHILNQKEFRVWILMNVGEDIINTSHKQNNKQNNNNSNNRNSERLSQFADKIRLTITKDLYKDISTSFNKYQQILQKQSDFFQKRKKMLLISQLCILHHLLIQFNDRYTQLLKITNTNNGKQLSSSSSSNNNILSLTNWDIKLIIQQINIYKIQQYSKQILHLQLINNLTYGSQISNQYLLQFLYYNSLQIIKQIITDRSIFWQTLWCDDKFPKDQQQYIHQIKNIINKNHYMQLFKLDHSLIKKININQYHIICKFYQNTVFYQGIGVSFMILDKLQFIIQQLKQLKNNKIQIQIKYQLQSLKNKINKYNKSHYKNIYHFCRIQYQKYIQIYTNIMKDINNCILVIKQQKQIIKGTFIQQFMLNIYRNIAPWEQSEKPITLKQYCQNFIKRLYILTDFINNFDNINNVVNCSMINNFKFYLQVIFQMWKIQRNQNKYKLVLIGVDKFIDEKQIIKKYGFQEIEHQNKYPQEKVYTDYGQKMKLEIDFKPISQFQKIQHLNCTKAKQKGILGYFFVQDLYLIGCELMMHKDNPHLKITGIDLTDQIISNIINIAFSLKKMNSLNQSNKSEKQFNDIKQSRIKALVLIIQDEDNRPKKVGSQGKGLQLFKNQTLKLVPISCYEYAQHDIVHDVDPIATLYTLAYSKQIQKIESQIIRNNIHFSLRA